MMGHMKTFWLFGFEWWGSLRPVRMWTRDGRCFVPLLLGLWIRDRKMDRPQWMEHEVQRLQRERRNAVIDEALLGLFAFVGLVLIGVVIGLLRI